MSRPRTTCPFLEGVARVLVELELVEPHSHARRKVAELSGVELAERRLYESVNRERIREASSRHYAANRERVLRDNARYRAENPDKERERCARYRAENREKERERSARYRAENPEKRRETNARYASANRDKLRAAKNRWRRENPEKARAEKARYRALKAGNVEPHPAEERWTVDPSHHTEAGECFWCGCALGDDVHVDHVIPISLGGREIPTNLVRSCPPCNLSKGAKHPDEWAAEIGWKDF